MQVRDLSSAAAEELEQLVGRLVRPLLRHQVTAVQRAAAGGAADSALSIQQTSPNLIGRVGSDVNGGRSPPRQTLPASSDLLPSGDLPLGLDEQIQYQRALVARAPAGFDRVLPRHAQRPVAVLRILAGFLRGGELLVPEPLDPRVEGRYSGLGRRERVAPAVRGLDPHGDQRRRRRVRLAARFGRLPRGLLHGRC